MSRPLAAALAATLWSVASAAFAQPPQGGDAAQSWAADREPVEITILGGAAQGTISLVMEALGEMIRREYPGSSYSYEPFSGVGAIAQLARGEVGFGVGAPAEMGVALRGDPPFSEPVAADTFGVVARLIDGLFAYVVASREFVEAHGVQHAGEALTRQPVRISLGQPGTLTIREQALALLDYYQTSPEKLESEGALLYHLPLGASIDLMKNRRLDLIFTVGFYPDRRVLELARALPITLLPFKRAAVDHMATRLGIEAGTVPAGAYDFLADDHYTTMASLYIIAGPAADPRTVYKVARAFHRQFEYLKGLHPLFADAKPERLPRAGAYQLHPAAARYYREVGLL